MHLKNKLKYAGNHKTIVRKVGKMKVLFLSEDEIAELLSIKEVMDVVENAFIEKAFGHVQMPPKTYLNFSKYNGDLRAMPAYLEKIDVATVKIVNSHPNNPKFGLPTVAAIILLINPKNGQPLSIMGGNNITATRTAAAGGLAIKYLARRKSKIAGFVGAGVQARAQLSALLSVVSNIEEIRVCDISTNSAESFALNAKKICPNCNINVVKNEFEAVSEADIVITTTPSRKPLVFNSWISKGTHINAIGADAPLKEELDPELLKRSKIIVDDYQQASHSGEINVPLSKGILSNNNIYAEIGEIIAEKKPARTSNDEITVFDSTGLAIQDAATVDLVYKKAKAQKIGHYINF